MRRLQIVVFVVLASSVVALFSAERRNSPAELLPKDLPALLKKLDKDGDGQISLQEWLKGGRKRSEFRLYDLNGDGFITPDEIGRQVKEERRLVLIKGRLYCEGAIEEGGDRYQDKKSKIFTIKLVEGRTYQIEQVSQVYYSYLYLEDPSGAIVDEYNSGGVGETARLTYRAAATGIYRLVATSQDGVRSGPFSLSIRLVDDARVSLPSWFRRLDVDHDGQVSLQEWLDSGRNLDEFRFYDLNDDGVITADEVLGLVKKEQRLTLDNKSELYYEDAIEEASDDRYQGKKTYKIFTIELKEDRVYQIEMVSHEFHALLYLEDPTGTIVAGHGSSGKGLTARVIHQVPESGIYRLVATSQDGIKTGDFSLSIRLVDNLNGNLPLKGLPSWFKGLDTDQDGQVSLQEWLNGGRKRDEFRIFDLNNDGVITADEVAQVVKRDQRLVLRNGEVIYHGAIEEPLDERYHDKKMFKVFTVQLNEGKRYHIEQVGDEFPACLYLEDPKGAVLAKQGSSEDGQPARLVYQAAETGTYRLIATSQNGVLTGDFSLSVRLVDDARVSLPSWFRRFDTNHNGQVSLQEWLDSGRNRDEFRFYDLNDDGVITADEVLRVLENRDRPRLDDRGQWNYRGAIEEDNDERYHNKKAKILTIQLEEGRIYQIEQTSQIYYAYLYLEDPSGTIVARNNSGGRGQTARLIYRAEETGTYRLVATTQDGVRSGDFSLSMRKVPDLEDSLPPQGLPPWFKELDTDGDGQVSLKEWLNGDRKADEFRLYDLNGDGAITAGEALQYLQRHTAKQKKENAKPVWGPPRLLTPNSKSPTSQP